MAGWWLGHPSEKYESQLGWLFPIYGKIKNGNQTTNQINGDYTIYKHLWIRWLLKHSCIPEAPWMEDFPTFALKISKGYPNVDIPLSFCWSNYICIRYTATFLCVGKSCSHFCSIENQLGTLPLVKANCNPIGKQIMTSADTTSQQSNGSSFNSFLWYQKNMEIWKTYHRVVLFLQLANTMFDIKW